MVKLLYHQYFKMHQPPRGSNHPERPERLDTLRKALREYGLDGMVERVTPKLGDLRVFEEVHSLAYVLDIIGDLESALDTFFLDPDTYISPGTEQALKALAGSVIEALDLVEEDSVFIAGRPPGHHAGRDGQAMGAITQGFCIFNTAALLAVRLSRKGKTVVLDFDVHHGNGTQEILLDHPAIVHVDLHQDYRTIYPWTGPPALRGKGNLYNINLPPGSGDDVYQEALEFAASIIEAAQPDYLVVSAGFDSYNNDNTFSNLRATSSTFHKLGELARRYKTVAVLEGGYGKGLERGLPAFIAGLAGAEDPVGDEPTQSGPHVVDVFHRLLDEISP